MVVSFLAVLFFSQEMSTRVYFKKKSGRRPQTLGLSSSAMLSCGAHIRAGLSEVVVVAAVSGHQLRNHRGHDPVGGLHDVGQQRLAALAPGSLDIIDGFF